MPDLQHPDPAPDSLLDAAAIALFELGRLFGRRPLRRGRATQAGPDTHRSRVLLVLAVETGAAASLGLSVGTVADQLGIDPSTASRLVSQAIADGLLRRDPSPTDRRLARLALTPAGRTLAADARRHQRAVFDDITRTWTDDERREFARLFTKFAADVISARTATPDAADAPVVPTTP